MFIATLLGIIDKTWKQPRCPPIDDWMKMCIHAMECYSAIKRSEILLFATWMDPEAIMLREINLRKTKTV